MKILIISGTFFPKKTPRAFRTTELAKELSSQGHNVNIITAEQQYNYTDFLQEHKNITIKKTIKTNRIWIRLLSPRINEIINRILGLLFEYPAIKYYFCLPKILKHEKDYDLIISIAVPHPIHWGVAKTFKKNKNIAKTWIADCGDPYMLNKTHNIPHPFYFKFLEKSFCKKADYITIPIGSAKKGYYPEFQDKLRIIPQGFNFEETKIIENYIPNQVITFGYAGSFIPNLRDPRPVLHYLSKLNIDFRFIVFTIQKHLFINYIEILKGKLILKEFIPREELLYELSQMDFLLNLENGTTVQSPSKLIDYALTKRPVLSLFSQKIDEDKINQFMQRDYTQQLIIKNIEDYNIKNVAKKFLSLAQK